MTEKKLPKAEFSGTLEIGELSIPCFVLNDGRRVITGRGMTSAIGMRGRGQGIKRIPTHGTLKPFIPNELDLAISNPIHFIGPGSREHSRTAGYEATVLQEICEMLLNARDAKALKTEQEIRYAQFADILIRAFARVGIIALVDEATGYQEVRARRALEEILEKFIAKELQKWAKMFPDEFYENLFRLKSWQYIPFSVKRPSFVGKMTNDLVYHRLAPGVLEELKRLNPKTRRGYRRHKHFQWLTEDIGHPKLREHLASVITLMKASSSWNGFYRLLQRSLPKQAQTLEMPLETENGQPV